MLGSPDRVLRAISLHLFVNALVCALVLSRITRAEDIQPAGKACAPGCTERGNCNIAEGRCECPIGLGGPTCQDLHMGACQASPNDLPFWGLFLPKNCQCYKEAAAFFNCSSSVGGYVDERTCTLTGYQYKFFKARCYHFIGRPPSEQWSLVPEEGDPNVTWHNLNPDMTLRSISEDKGREAITLWGNADCKAQPQHKCMNNCSMRGSCVKGCNPPHVDPSQARCECHKGFKGADCSLTDTSLCINACMGRGNCTRGFCHCQPPWFGLDCSRSQSPPPRPDHVPPRSRPRIFMYELPHSISSFVGLDDNVPDASPIYTAYLHFLSIFQQDWAVRTEDPWDANLFYLPALTYCYSSNTGDPGPHLRRVINYVRNTFPFFNRSGGKDHILWMTGDHGSCRIPPEATSLIQIVHFGYHKHDRIQGPSVIGVQPYDPVHGCFLPGRDVVTAPVNSLGSAEAEGAFRGIQEAEGEDPNRTKLFFFAGGVRSDRRHYSGGVRQAIQDMLLSVRNSSAGANLSDIVFIEGSTDQYRQLYRTSRFCLAPHGSGFGIRLSIAIVHACIPVVIQDHVFQPFYDSIPYPDFSVRIAKRDIPDLIPILRSISEQEQRKMRLAMAAHYRAFIWEPHLGGLAYNYTLNALHRRLQAWWGELYRRRRGLAAAGTQVLPETGTAEAG